MAVRLGALRCEGMHMGSGRRVPASRRVDGGSERGADGCSMNARGEGSREQLARCRGVRGGQARPDSCCRGFEATERVVACVNCRIEVH